MLRKFRPRLDGLERKELLSAGPGLVDSVAAVAVRTPSGFQVVEAFTVTNVSDHEILVDIGAADGFGVSWGGKVVRSPTAGFVPQIIAVHPLEPGQSYTMTGTWDGRSNLVDPTEPGKEGPLLSGTFAISSGLDPAKTATVAIPSSWTAPLRATHVAPPKPTPPRPHH